MLRVTPSRMSSHGGTNTRRRTVLSRQVNTCMRIYVFSCYRVSKLRFTLCANSSLDDHASRCSVPAIIVLRGRESITRQWAITHLRHTILGSVSIQESNDDGDADKRVFISPYAYSVHATEFSNANSRRGYCKYRQLIVGLASPGTTRLPPRRSG